MNPQRRLLPSLSALAAFDALARTGSFTHAAGMLDLTQGAVSRQVAALEEQLGVRLVERNSRRVALTRAGERYSTEIAGALETIRKASLRAMTRTGKAELNLAILPTFGTRWLMPRIPEFVRAHPQITLNFTTRIGWFNLAETGSDAAIHVGRPDWPGGTCTLLMEERVMPVAAPGFLARHPVKTPGDMAQLARLDLHSRAEAWPEWFAARGLHMRAGGIMAFEQFATLTQACVAGLGLALLPEFLIGPELESGALLPVGPAQRNGSGYYFVEPEGQNAPAPVAAFRDWLCETAGKGSASGTEAAGH